MSPPLDLVFVIDPIGSLNAVHDTSVALMESAQARGHRVLVTTMADLRVCDARAVALCRPALQHVAVTVDSTDELIESTAAIARDAVHRGEPVLAAFPDDVADRLRGRLGRDGDTIDVESYDACYDVAPRTLARFVDAVCSYVADGHRPTLMGGPMLVGREPDDALSWMQMESVLNDALAGVDARLVCCYPRRGPGAWVSAAAQATHPLLLDGRATVPSPGYLDPAAFLAAHPEGPGPTLGEPDVEVSFDRSTLRRARRLVEGCGRRVGLAQAREQDLVLAVNEAVSNSVEHGAGTGTVRLWSGRGALTCEVHDLGRLSDPFLGLLPPSSAAPRGRGLWLIRQLPDRTRLWTDPGGTTVRMTVLV